MNEKFKYEFDQTTGILYKSYHGLITIKDITSSWEFAFKNNLIPKEVKGYILDYRQASLDIEIKDHMEIATFFEEHDEFFGDHRIAIITEHPKDLIIPILVETVEEGFSSKPFSTIEAATTWVLMNKKKF